MTHETTTGIDNRKMALWVMIGSECMLFGSLIINYLIQVHQIAGVENPDLIRPAQVINVPVTSLSTFVLLMSSLAMVLSLNGLQHGDIAQFRKWCFGTAGLGAIFLGFQAYEFTEFYWEGLGLTANNFGAAFFLLTGTHGAHVLVGVIWLLIMGGWSYRTSFQSEHHSILLEVAGLYWHFVDVIWIIIFTVVYLFVLAP
ncbi:MAG: cytochrome oxidase subunit III [SAR324 cluster bacterium]|uniref:Cytochrome oxidase subunit III n=1 Tax=SAR324 cluster bacterium TaxID=2024889 RepID=A0A2A4T6F0_9DELT|nr:MAG: cytochrome oxidase subunit III [SAR324 cluster bacterium]